MIEHPDRAKREQDDTAQAQHEAKKHADLLALHERIIDALLDLHIKHPARPFVEYCLPRDADALATSLRLRYESQGWRVQGMHSISLTTMGCTHPELASADEQATKGTAQVPDFWLILRFS